MDNIKAVPKHVIKKYMNIFTMLSSSRDSNKSAIGNVIKVYNSSVCIQS